MNLYRATAGLGPAEENETLSRGIWQHARYMVRHDLIKHFEKPGDDLATEEGAAAAAASDLAGSTRTYETEGWAIDTWMQAPFHAVGILDPGLRKVGFGLYSRADGKNIQTAAGINILSGRQPPSPSIAYPIVWPGNGATVPITAFTSEYPSPLTSCDGYKAPAGLPLIVQLGAGDAAPQHTRSWLYAAGQQEQLEHCVFDQNTYRNSRRDEQALGRGILASRNAIVIVPRRHRQRQRPDHPVDVPRRQHRRSADAAATQPVGCSRARALARARSVLSRMP